MVDSSIFFWWKIEITFFHELEESLISQLNGLGINNYAIELSIKNSFRQTLSAWLPSDEWSKNDRDGLQIDLHCLSKSYPGEQFSIKWEKVSNKDWSSIWKKYWAPNPIGEKILILPSWLDLPAQYSNRTVLKLDPGSAFGTGSHQTTRLCLEALESFPLKGIRVADIGCGSGILGIAALRLGAKEVNAVDIDLSAVKATSENALLNDLNQTQLAVSLGSLDVLKMQLKNNKADLIICNTLAHVIKDLAPKFDLIGSDKSHLLLSGLLVHQVADLTSFLSILGWGLLASYRCDEWSLIHLCRKAS
ncbi:MULTISPECIES: 50S ribosomal protein L11 methyltransferase [unclassified Prochlorococcus]|uniref:50S ribosomal protein L11 methyltransferase n=1 Tax=unclassified Prochlorococcus TaxID=2627481 RepID=UPI000533A3E8|nr:MULTISPECIES: 50S ribosomal protein L11 methyltransferase [unclassified Prochlorococcus]KGG16201.1 Ribosomal protein L11 methyltransferase [Prochlorococcus sp. MIT 0603]KGG18064.1 Ribosomal protein L11 methyltransferase [Prochlorococcus sp. MIT 0602]